MLLKIYNFKRFNRVLKLFIVPLLINFISLTLVALNEMNGETDLIKIGLIVIGGSYLLTMVFYLPPLIVLRWIRGQHILHQNIFTCLTIVLWSFTPIAVAWIILSVITFFGQSIPWKMFSYIFFWGKALFVPFSICLSYWKLTHENFYTSIIDSMITSLIVLILLSI